MPRIAVVLAVLLQGGHQDRPTIITRPVEPPGRNTSIIYYDDQFLLLSRHYGDVRDRGGATEPGLFAHSKATGRWLQIRAISTAGARLGSSSSNDPAARRRLRVASVTWDFRPLADQPYIEQPLRTSGSIAFPDSVVYDSSSGRYELHYFSSWGIASAETVLYVSREDLIAAFIAAGPAPLR
jgi:hypothetical protein